MSDDYWQERTPTTYIIRLWLTDDQQGPFMAWHEKNNREVRAQAFRDAAEIARSYSNSGSDHAAHIAGILDERAGQDSPQENRE